MHDLLRYCKLSCRDLLTSERCLCIRTTDTDTVWKNFYTLEHLAGYNPVAEYWLHVAFKDAALIHVFIGCADAYSRGYDAIISGTKGLRHFYEAISLVNQRIQDISSTVSGTTLAIIAALAMLEVFPITSRFALFLIDNLTYIRKVLGVTRIGRSICRD